MNSLHVKRNKFFKAFFASSAVSRFYEPNIRRKHSALVKNLRTIHHKTTNAQTGEFSGRHFHFLNWKNLPSLTRRSRSGALAAPHPDTADLDLVINDQFCRSESHTARRLAAHIHSRQECFITDFSIELCFRILWIIRKQLERAVSISISFQINQTISNFTDFSLSVGGFVSPPISIFGWK